jgi:hypothetical protein
MNECFEPAFMPWKELTINQRFEITWTHAMQIPDFDSLELFMANVKSLIWSRDARPAQERLVHRPSGQLELTGLWYGFNEDRLLKMNPPSMCRLSDEAVEAMESKLYAPSIAVTLSPYAAKIIARALGDHAGNRRTMASEAKAFECAHEMCIIAAEEAEAAASVLSQCVSKWEAENLVW